MQSEQGESAPGAGESVNPAQLLQENEALKQHNNQLTAAVDDLQQQIEELLTKDQSSFPQ